jgi:aminomethyltransferase
MDYLSTNRIVGKSPGSATYTVWCDPHGGSVDDVIIYKVEDSHFFVIVNAGNRDKDLIHLVTQAEWQRCDVKIEERFSRTGILALQGPASLPLLASFIPIVESLKPMHFLALNDQEELYVSRTGYTGAGGFEIYGPEERIVDWWDKLIDRGKAFHLQPVGLGARDTLRLEMGFALYGHELSDSIAPNESVSAWTVKWDKSNFAGKEALEAIERSSKKRHAYGVRLLDAGVPRQGCHVLKEGVMIGEATSGSFSPVLGKGIALILAHSPLKTGDQVVLQIRQTLCRAEVADLPFVRKNA